MGSLCKRYFSRLKLLRPSDDEENLELRVSRTSCRVVYPNIRGLHKNFSALSLIAREIVFFFWDSCFFQAPHFRAIVLGLADRCSCSGVKFISFEG